MPGRATPVLVILAVADVARARAFYTAAFGWPVRVDVPVYVELEAPGGLRVGLYERRGFGRNTGRVPTAPRPGELAPTELYLRVDDLGAACRDVEAAGARPLSPPAPRDWGDVVAYFADPDGTVLALAAPVPRD